MATGTIILPILSAAGDATNPPALAFTAANRPHLLFDAATDELCSWHFRAPENYDPGTDPVLKVQYSMDTATTLEVIIACEVMAVTDGENVETDSYDSANTSAATTVPGTATFLDEISLTLANHDTSAAGDYMSIRLSRDANNAGDDATGDMFIWAVSLEYTTT